MPRNANTRRSGKGAPAAQTTNSGAAPVAKPISYGMKSASGTAGPMQGGYEIKNLSIANQVDMSNPYPFLADGFKGLQSGLQKQEAEAERKAAKAAAAKKAGVEDANDALITTAELEYNRLREAGDLEGANGVFTDFDYSRLSSEKGQLKMRKMSYQYLGEDESVTAEQNKLYSTTLVTAGKSSNTILQQMVRSTNPAVKAAGLKEIQNRLNVKQASMSTQNEKSAADAGVQDMLSMIDNESLGAVAFGDVPVGEVLENSEMPDDMQNAVMKHWDDEKTGGKTQTQALMYDRMATQLTAIAPEQLPYAIEYASGINNPGMQEDFMKGYMSSVATSNDLDPTQQMEALGQAVWQAENEQWGSADAVREAAKSHAADVMESRTDKFKATLKAGLPDAEMNARAQEYMQDNNKLMTSLGIDSRVSVQSSNGAGSPDLMQVRAIDHGREADALLLEATGVDFGIRGIAEADLVDLAGPAGEFYEQQMAGVKAWNDHVRDSSNNVGQNKNYDSVLETYSSSSTRNVGPMMSYVTGETNSQSIANDIRAGRPAQAPQDIVDAARSIAMARSATGGAENLSETDVVFGAMVAGLNRAEKSGSSDAQFSDLANDAKFMGALAAGMRVEPSSMASALMLSGNNASIRRLAYAATMADGEVSPVERDSIRALVNASYINPETLQDQNGQISPALVRSSMRKIAVPSKDATNATIDMLASFATLGSGNRTVGTAIKLVEEYKASKMPMDRDATAAEREAQASADLMITTLNGYMAEQGDGFGPDSPLTWGSIEMISGVSLDLHSTLENEGGLDNERFSGPAGTMEVNKRLRHSYDRVQVEVSPAVAPVPIEKMGPKTANLVKGWTGIRNADRPLAAMAYMPVESLMRSTGATEEEMVNDLPKFMESMLENNGLEMQESYGRHTTWSDIAWQKGVQLNAMPENNTISISSDTASPGQTSLVTFGDTYGNNFTLEVPSTVIGSATAQTNNDDMLYATKFDKVDPRRPKNISGAAVRDGYSREGQTMSFAEYKTESDSRKAALEVVGNSADDFYKKGEAMTAEAKAVENAQLNKARTATLSAIPETKLASMPKQIAFQDPDNKMRVLVFEQPYGTEAWNPKGSQLASSLGDGLADPSKYSVHKSGSKRIVVPLKEEARDLPHMKNLSEFRKWNAQHHTAKEVRSQGYAPSPNIPRH